MDTRFPGGGGAPSAGTAFFCILGRRSGAGRPFAALRSVGDTCKLADLGPDSRALVLAFGLRIFSGSVSLNGAPRAPFKVRDPGTVKLLEVREDDEVDGWVLSAGRFRV